MNIQEKFEYIVNYIKGDKETRINSIMEPELYKCNDTEKTSQIRFKTKDWQKNQWDNVHGGAIATMFDIAIGMSIMAFYDYKQVSTTDISINYIRPFDGESFIFHVDIIHAGKILCRARALAYDEKTKKCLASATASYIHN